jgi:hypothetical protein
MGCMKMIDLAVKLAEGVYLYKNFYPDIKELEDILENNEDWNSHGNYEPNDHPNKFWNGKLSPDFIDKKFHDYIINLISPEYWILSHGNFMKLTPEDLCPVYNNNTPEEFKYILAYYVGDFTGGKITFLDADIDYQPERNDLILFKPTSIDISKVESGVRYSYLDYLIKHPGYIMV